MAGHVAHLAVAASRQPGQQTRLGGAQIHIGDADLGKSELSGPRRQCLRHLLRKCLGPWLHLPLSLTPVLIHPPILESRTFSWPDEAACERFAAALAAEPALRRAGIELDGPLGAGKTTFVRHLLRALGVSGRIKSPTYTVVEPYQVNGLAVSHFDFYRFNDPREWEDAGFRELFAAPGLRLSEWADKARAVLPPPDLRLAIEPQDDDSRRVTALAGSALGQALLAAGARA
ncbi:tRNA (adenosine(37)-N6)-threonylcarbamoyltransferase complex ATPase subunit type 1 TsaE [Ideonella sp. 4Y11]|uniref:tRNA threonylcarbamoyladenosine biosynthesis protein TsaE n=1 Tax=Ideonella aquatica TaxID=2824119 RepID=A0A941BH93_9BURK|nr:tRNA (adenosine(37)-N6)-threonylcarbamoyltransferase complex ATPase subunit type 1 TsaE [Ideonella aquatica]